MRCYPRASRRNDMRESDPLSCETSLLLRASSLCHFQAEETRTACQCRCRYSTRLFLCGRKYAWKRCHPMSSEKSSSARLGRRLCRPLEAEGVHPEPQIISRLRVRILPCIPTTRRQNPRMQLGEAFQPVVFGQHGGVEEDEDVARDMKVDRYDPRRHRRLHPFDPHRRQGPRHGCIWWSSCRAARGLNERGCREVRGTICIL